jgi:hypothetical protein
MEAQVRKQTSFPIVAGVLDIVVGVLSLLGTLGCIIAVVIFTALADAPFLEDMWAELEAQGFGSDFLVVVLVVVALLLAAIGILALLGGTSAVKRRRWGLALAGSIAAIFVWNVLGILAVVFVAIAKDEFE